MGAHDFANRCQVVILNVAAIFSEMHGNAIGTGALGHNDRICGAWVACTSGLAQRGNRVSFGEYALQATSGGRITARQIEAARRAITRHVKRGAKVWIRIFPDKPITQKPIEVRMGKGKGNPEYWVAVVKPGTMLFELDGIPEKMARECMRLADAKLGLRTMLVTRH